MTETTVPPTLASVIQCYIADRAGRGEIGASTARQFRVRLAGLVAVCPADQAAVDVDRDVIRRWQLSIGHYSPASRRSYLCSVRTFCRWAVESGFMTLDPTAGLARVREPRRVPRALSAAQVARVFAAASFDARMKAILWLMVGCGLRCVEVANLGVADYDPDAATVFVTGKFDNQRVLPVPEEVSAAVDLYLHVAGHTTGPLIRVAQGGQGAARGATGDRISRQVSELFKAAGVKEAPKDGRSAHALCHTCASDVLDRCHDLRVVKELLGHLHLSSTEIYLRGADLNQLRAAMAGRSYRPAV